MAILQTHKKTQQTQYHHRHALSKAIVLGICTSVGLLMNSLKGNYLKTRRNDSKMTCAHWVKELLQGHNGRFRSALGLRKHVFDKLLAELTRKAGLQDTRYRTAKEQLAIFLYMVTTGLSNRKTQEQVQRSADTVSK